MQVLAETEIMHNACEKDATRKKFRGSSLFLAGRFLSMSINLSAQVLMFIGFNLQTLKIFERLRYIIAASIVTALANVLVCAPLIKLCGATGGALGSTAALIGYNLALQAGLWPTAHFHVFDRRYLSVYLTIALSARGLLLAGFFTSLSLYALFPAAACVSLGVFALTKKLNIAETFPELLRLPFMRLVFT